MAADTAADAAWLTVDSYALPPHSFRILLLEQTGPDLLVRARYADGSGFEQDGHDTRFGTEVVLLENPGDAPAVAELSVRVNSSGLEPAWQIRELSRPTALDYRIASNLSRAAQQLLLDDYESAAAFALWAEVSVDDSASPLFTIAAIQHLQAMMGDNDYTSVLATLPQLTPAITSTPEIAIYLTWLEAICHWQIRAIDTALTKFEELVELLTQNPEVTSTGRLLDRHHIHAHHGATIVNAGLRSGDTALLQRGAAMIDTALSNAAPYADYRLLGELHNFVSGYSTMLYNRIDEDGSKALDIAEHYYELAHDRSSLAAIKNNKAFVLLGKGRVGEAQALYREALQITERSRDQYYHSFYMARLAASYLSTGDLARAEALYLEAIGSMRERGIDRVATASQIELATVYYLQGRHADAITHLQQLRASIADDSWVEESLQIHTGLARNLLANGDARSAREQITLASTYVPLVNRLNFRLDHQSVSAALLLSEGKHLQAIELIEVALGEIAVEFQEAEQQLELYRLLAKAYFESGEFTEALQAGEQALALIANTRSQIDINRQGPTWSARTNAIISQHIEHQLTLYEDSGDRQYLDAAFRNMQQHRALSLRQSRMLSALPTAGEESEQLLSLWTQMNEANQALLAASIKGLPLAELETELLARQEAYRNVATAATPAQFAGNDATLTLQQIQQTLEPGTLALSFHITATSAWRLAVTDTSVDLQRFDNVQELATLGEAFLAAMDVNRPADLSAFRELGALVFPNEISAQRLVIEADSWLGGLPFAALPLPGATGYDPAVNHFSSIQASSLSTYFISLAAARPRSEPRNSIAIFADPAFTDADTAVVGAAVPAARGLRAGLDQLPFTRIEAEAIVARFGDRSPRVYTGSDATIPNLLAEQNRTADILHIATHGFANTSGTSLSGLALAAAPGHASGLLTIEEISRHVFSNQLIVISGCETGQGELLDGEGVMSIARAFMAQGAKAVIATLWPISDRATATFMNHFYAALLDTNDIAAALQNAQQQLAKSADYRHPWYWSGFVLNVADAGARPLAEPQSAPAPTVAVAD